MGLVESVLAGNQSEETLYLFRETDLYPHSRSESRIIEFAATQRFKSTQHFLAP